MTGDDDSVRVDRGFSDEIIYGALQTPRPSRDGSAVIRRIRMAEILLEPSLVGRVWIYVAVVKCRQGVTTIDQIVDPPNVGPGTATRVSSPVFHNTHAALGHPVIREAHFRIAKERVI